MCSDDGSVTYDAIFGSGSDDDDEHGSYSHPEGEAMECDDSCSHPIVLKLMCTICGQDVPDGYGLPFGYIMKDLRLSKIEADRQRYIETTNILSKKLILVLDLNKTLLQSKYPEALTPEEKYMENQIERETHGKMSLKWNYGKTGPALSI
ncbi:hypothetical protein RCOM_1513430 [Ricinus communis]|uniref:protein-serine/threonine phosphatase n=1 Tax=Ricinus communis TaxID=3988 RepID=B9R939_RICCO|nr:hypothetical protein RCOM_1513430 [Ricinus communis]